MNAGGLLIALLMAIAAGAAHSAQPHLVIDAGGHTAAVNKIRFLNEEQLVSVSNDKTIRIWSLAGGETIDVLRPPIGTGEAGMLYALDISPDRRWLAAGGYEYSGDDHGVYLIDLAERKIDAVLRGHSNVIIDVAFSHDGRWLASASADKTARIWDVKSRRCIATLRGHREGVYAVAFAPDNQQLATASLDKTAHVWSVPAGDEMLKLPVQAAPLQAIGWSPDGERLAIGAGDGSITLWSHAGKLQRRFEKLGNQVTSLRFLSKQRLFFTLGGAGERDGGFFINLATNSGSISFTQHDNSVLDGVISPSGELVATADANGEILIWRAANGELVQRLRGHGARPWSAAWDVRGNTIVWGTTSQFVEPNQRGRLQLAFDLEQLDYVALPTEQVRQARTRLGNITTQLGDDNSLSVMRAGREPIHFQLPAARDEIRCFTLLDASHVAIGSDFGLYIFDVFDEKRSHQLHGHEGAIWALAPSNDNKYLLTAADDQTLRIWDWQAGVLLMSLFFADRQWIAWTPQGYYASSPGGERLMGWHVADAPNSLATFYPAAQFRDSLYRPDIIRKLLDVGSIEGIIATSQATAPEVSVSNIAEALPPIVTITQPQTSPQEIDQPRLQIRATAHSRSEHSIVALRILLDGRPYEGTKGVFVVPSDAGSENGETGGQWMIELSPGQHTLIVQAETEVSKGLSAPLVVTVKEPSDIAADESLLPNLYVLAIGIESYPGPLRLNFAAHDAQNIAATWQKVGQPLFREIKVQLQTNEQATRRQILNGLSWLRREMTQRDVAVFFFSGHGAKDDTGTFYLVPVDGEPRDLLSTGVAATQFKDALAAIPGRVLVLLDACHAGAAGGDQRKAVYVLTDDLIRDLATDDYGVIVMSSSMGREYSMESDDHQQGYFTLALIEALNGKADLNNDRFVYLTEIDAYVSDRVKVLTQGAQHPVTTKPSTIRSFPLSQP